MKPNEFTASYGDTLQTNPKTNQVYIKLPIADLNELSYMQESLLEFILLLSQLEKSNIRTSKCKAACIGLANYFLVITHMPSLMVYQNG
ncbi:hypothetical protein [Flavivirga jejuensis]|uniref:Uncharacterized protein n=1 Tax=Flavivirga jejuensis TaxID=870487 RepID=A0ABT8WNQ2_9FLAO|nr:hypothetical protein [Flavivirga jejuensis]MDO5974795.1 hypothetical protein [Flavivirga jejuensis]